MQCAHWYNAGNTSKVSNVIGLIVVTALVVAIKLIVVTALIVPSGIIVVSGLAPRWAAKQP
ncbi:hypothetical protein [Pseudomonas sp. TE3911]